MDVFAASFMVGLTGAVAPGPLLALVLSETLKSGITASLLIVTGHSLLELLAVLGLTMGLATILANALISALIGAVGGAVMLYFAYLMITDAARGVNAPGTSSGPQSARVRLNAGKWLGYLGLGALISLSNPYWTVWWATIGAGFMTTVAAGGGAAIHAFYFGHILADYVWYVLVAVLVLTGSRMLGNRTYRFLLAGCGVCLVLFGAYFLFNSFSQILS